jgi:hypothetical protein
MIVDFIPLFFFVLADEVRKIRKYYVMFFFSLLFVLPVLHGKHVTRNLSDKNTKKRSYQNEMKQRDVTKTPKVYQNSPPLATLSLPICHPSYRHQREQSRMTNCSEKSWKVFKYFNHPSGKKLCSIIAHCSTNN